MQKKCGAVRELGAYFAVAVTCGVSAFQDAPRGRTAPASPAWVKRKGLYLADEERIWDSRSMQHGSGR